MTYEMPSSDKHDVNDGLNTGTSTRSCVSSPPESREQRKRIALRQ